MKVKQYRYWQKYIDICRGMLLLGQWKTILAKDASDNTALAEVSVTEKRRVAHIYLCNHWEHQDPKEQREAICHELVHLHLHDLSDYATKVAKDSPGPVADERSDILLKFEEIAVDQISRVLAPTLPLPKP